MIKEQLNSVVYSYMSSDDKHLIVEFTAAMNTLGHQFDKKNGDGFCYGRHMMIIRKANVKSDKIYARLYFRTSGVVVRFFLNDVSKHSNYIEASPSYIQESFTGSYATCNHCRSTICKFRKAYTIASIGYEKCNGLAFAYFAPTLDQLPSYMNLFLEFYPNKDKKVNITNKPQ